MNPLLDAATSRNDFDLRELRKRPMSIYVGVHPDDLHAAAPGAEPVLPAGDRLADARVARAQSGAQTPGHVLLDEFTALGRIPIMAEAISYLPGYNVRVLLVIQASSQLREVYGTNAAETMMKSLAARVLFAPKDFAEANEISEELGSTTVRVKSQSRPRFSLFAMKGHSRAA